VGEHELRPRGRSAEEAAEAVTAAHP
jgi:hypothetical protein